MPRPALDCALSANLNGALGDGCGACFMRGWLVGAEPGLNLAFLTARAPLCTRLPSLFLDPLSDAPVVGEGGHFPSNRQGTAAFQTPFPAGLGWGTGEQVLGSAYVVYFTAALRVWVLAMEPLYVPTATWMHPSNVMKEPQ